MYCSRRTVWISVRISRRAPSGSDLLGLFRNAASYREVHQPPVLPGVGRNRRCLGVEDLSSDQEKTGNSGSDRTEHRNESISGVHGLFSGSHRGGAAKNAWTTSRNVEENIVEYVLDQCFPDQTLQRYFPKMKSTVTGEKIYVQETKS